MSDLSTTNARPLSSEVTDIPITRDRKPGTWFSLFRFEWTKMAGRTITWVPFLVIAIVGGLIVGAFYKSEFKFAIHSFKSASLIFDDKSGFANGYFMTAGAMNAMFQMLIPIFISVASGLMVAGEAEQGTLRACLIRPVARTRLILSKFAMLWVYAMVISLFAIGVLVVLGVANFGHGTLYAFNNQFHNGEGVSIIVERDVPLRIFYAWLLGAVGMTVLASLALMVSSLVETAAMAYVLTLSIYFAFMTLRQFPFLEFVHPYLFVTHMLRWQQVFYSEIKVGEINVSLIHEAAYIIFFLSAAALLFKEKDIKS